MSLGYKLAKHILFLCYFKYLRIDNIENIIMHIKVEDIEKLAMNKKLNYLLNRRIDIMQLIAALTRALSTAIFERFGGT